MDKIRYVPTPTVCTVFASKSRRTDTLVSFSQVITGASVLTNVWILSANIYSWKELSKFESCMLKLTNGSNTNPTK